MTFWRRVDDAGGSGWEMERPLWIQRCPGRRKLGVVRKNWNNGTLKIVKKKRNLIRKTKS